MKRTILAAALAALPLAAFAVETDTEVVEYYNVTNNHYFVTATAADARFIDNGGAGQGWVRTGRSFRAWLDAAKAGAGTTPVYRFYSSAANSHFYTASADEVALLRGLEAQERARTGTVTGWQYEGEAFRIEAPVNGSCAAGTIAMQRVYNNGFASGEGANHRFVDDSELRALMQDRSWIAEGVAFCAQSKSTGTNANLPITTTNFEVLSGGFSGPARWKTEIAGTERKVTANLALSFAADGAVTGSGRGCAFTGQVAQGDGFRSLFTGTLAATGCEDAAFNGTYRRFQLERFGNGTLAVRLKRGDDANEAAVEAVLAGGQPVTTPPATPATPVSAGIAGDWSGTIAWSAFSRTGGVTTPLVSANQALTLRIADAGALTGSGFGCSFAGTLSPTAVAGTFGGTVTAAGCTESAFNGSYAQAKVKRDDGKLEVELERESESAGVTTKAQVEGKLVSGATTPTTPAPPATPGIAGSFTGAFTASIETRTRTNGTEIRATTSVSGTVSLAVASGGALTGAGFGCGFAGSLTLSDAATQRYTGTVTASGCADAAHNGSYAASAHPEDGGRLEVEMERESETSTVRTKVRIEGTATRA